MIEIQIVDYFDKPGDTREVMIGHQTLDTDGSPPLCHNNTVHSGQSEELGSVSPLVTGNALPFHFCLVRLNGLPD